MLRMSYRAPLLALKLLSSCVVYVTVPFVKLGLYLYTNDHYQEEIQTMNLLVSIKCVYIRQKGKHRQKLLPKLRDDKANQISASTHHEMHYFATEMANDS